MNNNVKFQLEKLAETIEQLKQNPRDFDADSGWTAEDIVQIDVDVLATRISDHIENYQNQELAEINQALADIGRELNADISRALKSMRLAISCSESTDKNLSRHARKLLKSWCHPVPNLKNSADHFSNLIDQQNVDKEPIFYQSTLSQSTLFPYIPVCDDYVLAVTTGVSQLQHVGKVLNNCVADYRVAIDYLSRYREGEFSIFTLLKDGEPFYLLTVEKSHRYIYECQGKNHRLDSKNELPFEVAIGILDKLNVTANDIADFVQAGAFSRFKSGRPETTPIEIDGIELWIWSYHNELIIGVDSNSDGRLSWSHFNRPFAESHTGCEQGEYRCNAIDLGRLLDLAIQSETLMKMLNNPTHH